MSATVTLTLDTTGPDVTFGAIGGATAGELLQVAYTSDEPVTSATLVRGVRRLVLDVLPDRFEALVPVDWFDGPASIEVADDVGNKTVYTGIITISSPVTGPAPAAPSGAGHSTATSGPPARRRPAEPERRRVGRTTRVGFNSTGAIAAQPAVATPVATGSAAVVATTATRTRRVAVGTDSTVAAAVNLSGRVSLMTGRRVTKRDGPDLEDQIILGLLG